MMHWFGDDWGAPICELTPHDETPIGEPCARCGVAIVASDQGVTMPFLKRAQTAPHTYEHARVALHLGCFLDSIGIKATTPDAPGVH